MRNRVDTEIRTVPKWGHLCLPELFVLGHQQAVIRGLSLIFMDRKLFEIGLNKFIQLERHIGQSFEGAKFLINSVRPC